MKKIIFNIIISTIISCGEFSVNQEILSESTEISGKVDWKLIAGIYRMDEKSLASLKLAKDSKFYFIINQDSTYIMNKYLDDDTIKIINMPYSNRISVRYFYDKNNKRMDSIKSYAFVDWPNRYNLFLNKSNSNNKPFIVASYFPDLNDPNAITDLAYVLKYEKISDIPIKLEELEKINE